MALMLASARRGVASLAAMPASRSMSTVVYANYACYDGNTVMSMRPSLPKFRSKSYGWSLSRRGAVALEFNERTEEEGRFVSENQTTFQLDLAEIGEIAVDTTGHLKFVHQVKREESQPIVKELVVQHDPTKRKVTFTLTVNNEGDAVTRSVSVTEGNFFSMKSIMVSALPHLAGWEMIMDPSKVTEQHYADQGERA